MPSTTRRRTAGCACPPRRNPRAARRPSRGAPSARCCGSRNAPPAPSRSTCWYPPGDEPLALLALRAGRPVLALQQGAQSLVEVDLLAADQADPLQPAAGHVQLLGARQEVRVGPDPVEPVDVGRGQHLAAEALALGRRGTFGVGPQELGEEPVGGLRVGQPPAHRRLDRLQGREPAFQGAPGDYHGVPGGQGQQHLELADGRLQGGARRAEQALAALQQLLEGVRAAALQRLEPVHQAGGVRVGLAGDVVDHPVQVVAQPAHPREQPLAGSKAPTFSGSSSTRAGSPGGMASSYWPSTERASCPTTVPACRPASSPPRRPTMSPAPGRPVAPSEPSASVIRLAPGSTRGANSGSTASAQSGRLSGRAASATPGAGRLVAGSTQSSARRRRSSQTRASPGSGAAAGLGSCGVIPRVSAPAAVATATWRASSQLTGPEPVAMSLANSRNSGMRPKKSAPSPGTSDMASSYSWGPAKKVAAG